MSEPRVYTFNDGGAIVRYTSHLGRVLEEIWVPIPETNPVQHTYYKLEYVLLPF